MTYIEFFDKYAVENIGASLSNPPDRVIFVGDTRKKMERFAERCRRLFAGRGYDIEFICKTVPRCQLDRAVETLTEIVNQYDDCVFDVTGGTEILNLALGVVFAQNPDKNIQIHQINFRNNTIQDCDADGATIYREPPSMSVQENILIHGGDVVCSTVDGEETYEWDLTDEFKDDLFVIWSICKSDPYDWNAQLAVFNAANTVGTTGEDGLTVTADYKKLLQELARHDTKYKEDKKILGELHRFGLADFANYGGEVTIAYKNKQIKRCLSKAGQALEMRTFLAALESVNDDDTYVYGDVLNGVVIDWDGEEKGSDTKNEIDIVMMHGVIPVFVSCKNGFFTSDELYKLSTVAERFGGKYAKKVLVTSVLDTLGPSEKYIRQRADDMGIRIIDNVRKLDLEQLANELRKCW